MGLSCLLQRIWPTRRTKQYFPLWQLGIAAVITIVSRKAAYSSGSLFLEACLIFEKCPVTPHRGNLSIQHCMIYSTGGKNFRNTFLGIISLRMVFTSVCPQEDPGRVLLRNSPNFQSMAPRGTKEFLVV